MAHSGGRDGRGGAGGRNRSGDAETRGRRRRSPPLEPPSLQLSCPFQPHQLAHVQARSTGKVWEKALAKLVVKPARIEAHVKSGAASQDCLQRVRNGPSQDSLRFFDRR